MNFSLRIVLSISLFFGSIGLSATEKIAIQWEVLVSANKKTAKEIELF